MNSQQNTTHIHYHYHYHHAPLDPAPVHRHKMTKSQDFHAREHREQDGGGDCHQREHAEEARGMSERERSFKKLKISNCWSTENCSREAEKQQTQTEAPSVRAFTVQEEQLDLDEDRPSSLSRHFRHVHLPPQPEDLSRVQKGLIAGYQSELAWYKKEVARLRLVEEECIYLRNSYMKHFESCPQNRE